MKVLLVDDEKLQLLRLEECVKEVLKDAEILSYTNPKLAIEENKDQHIDIAFLDIEMPVINGLMLAKQLKRINPTINIVFVTAYNHYALDAYQIHASGYVTKPVNVQKIKNEVDGLRYPVNMNSSKKVSVKCFGNFEVFVDGEPLKFSYSKSKELFAYLVDREGSAININELNAVLWDEDHKSYLRNLVSDIKKTFNDAGVKDVFIKRHNECFVNVENIECDAYEYKKNNPDAIRLYRGEYMIQYPWAMFKDE